MQGKIIDDVARFIQSDTYKIIKYRLLVSYKKQLQSTVNMHLRNGDHDKATLLLGHIDCLSEVIQITERLGSEIKDGMLDVDEALHVIENK